MVSFIKHSYVTLKKFPFSLCKINLLAHHWLNGSSQACWPTGCSVALAICHWISGSLDFWLTGFLAHWISGSLHFSRLLSGLLDSGFPAFCHLALVLVLHCSGLDSTILGSFFRLCRSPTLKISYSIGIDFTVHVVVFLDSATIELEPKFSCHCSVN